MSPLSTIVLLILLHLFICCILGTKNCSMVTEHRPCTYKCTMLYISWCIVHVLYNVHSLINNTYMYATHVFSTFLAFEYVFLFPLALFSLFISLAHVQCTSTRHGTSWLTPTASSPTLLSFRFVCHRTLWYVQWCKWRAAGFTTHVVYGQKLFRLKYVIFLKGLGLLMSSCVTDVT